MAAAVAAGMIVFGAAPSHAQQTGARASGFAYDPASGLMTQQVIEPDLPAFRLQTDYSRNAFGAIISATVSGADIATRASSVAYDARGRFPISTTNALSQSESFTYDPRFGTPLTRTDANGLVTSWQYDSLGRVVLEVRADGTRSTWAYDYCSGPAGGTLTCPALATHRVEAKYLAADGVTPIAPSEQTYFDELGRRVLAQTQGFDGTLVRIATEYDGLGRVARQSRPYFEGATPQWQQASYDVLNRPVVETFADGSTVTSEYHGLTASETNALNQTNSATTNSQGQVVSVTDAASSSTTYRYDPFGNLSQITDPQGNVTLYLYDRAGRRIGTTDPDMGSWTYRYDALGQLLSQTDAKGQTVTVNYDLLGRPVTQTAPDGSSSWTYDTAPMGIGKLATAATNSGYSRSHSYDTLGRPSQLSIAIDGQGYGFTTTYDAASRVSTIGYPSGFTAAYGYTALGYQAQLKNAATGETYWTANARDAELHLVQQTFGNGVITNQGFDPKTGRLLSIQAGPGGALQNFSYNYDLIGNVTNRNDANNAVSESFTYDALNRLRTATIGLDLSKAFTYDSIGNLLTKSDVGTYTYPAPGQPRPHAVASIAGSVINTTFSYDENGNQTAGNGLRLAYNSSDKPVTISRGVALLTFAHDPEQQRYKQTGPAGETLHLAASGVSAEKFSGSAGAVRWTNYLFADGERIGMRVEYSGGAADIRYFHKDHLGSTAALSNENGALVEQLAYDAWGKRRFSNGQDDPAGSLTSQTTRGFTGHEHLAEVGLVHMNGRVYDPVIGRMISPDPLTPDPLSTQGWNRYSYANNNPVSFTDPTGHQTKSADGKGNSGDSGKGNSGDSGKTTGQSSSGADNRDGGYAGRLSGALRDRAPQAFGTTVRSMTDAEMAEGGVRAGQIMSDGSTMLRGLVIGSGPSKVGDGGGVSGAGSAPSLSARPSKGNSGNSSSSASSTGVAGVAMGVMQDTVSIALPGAHYADQAQQSFLAGDYLSGSAYAAMSMVDAAAGLATLGATTLEGAVARWGSRQLTSRTAAVADKAVEFAGGTQTFVDNLSHVTGKAGAARNRAIQAVIAEDLPNLRMTFKPQYNPFTSQGIAKQGAGTQIGRKMFSSRKDLRDTIVHEELHHRWWGRGLFDHHPAGTAKEAQFYGTLARYYRMRGW